MDQHGERPDVIGQFLAGIAQSLNLGLGGRIGDGEPANLAVRAPERDRRLGGS